jgi:hypothetical protein
MTDPSRPHDIGGLTTVASPAIADLEFGATLLSGADDAARRMASQICPPGTTPHDREALGEFIRKVSRYIRWPDSCCIL